MPNIKDVQEKIKALGPQKVLGILAYLSFLVLVPWLVARRDKFVQFHVRQGLILLVLEAATWLLGIIPILGWLAIFILWIIWTILSIYGIMVVLRGEEKPLPIIGQFAKKIKI